MLHASRYNHFVWDDSVGLVFNARTGRCLYFGDGQIKFIVSALRSLPDCSEWSVLEADTQRLLTQAGFVVPNNNAEREEVLSEDDADREPHGRLSLTILPTMQCNLGCAYCYQGRSNETSIRDRAGELTRFVSEFIQENDVRVFDVTWFGGEPLLGLKAIRRLTKQFEEICSSNGVEYIASIVSNGTLIDRRLAHELSSLRIRHAQITLDGHALEHDRRRSFRWRDGSSFASATAAVDVLAEFMRVTVRINVDGHNLNSAFELISFAEYRGWLKPDSRIELYVAPLENISSRCDVKKFDILDMARFAEFEAQFLRQLAEKAPHSTEALPKPLTSVCSVVRKWSFVVNPDLGITKCTNDTGLGLNDTEAWTFSVRSDQDCLECEIMPLCKGGCPAHRRYEGRPRRDWCAGEKYNLHEKLKHLLIKWREDDVRSSLDSIGRNLVLPESERKQILKEAQDSEYTYWPVQRMPQEQGIRR